MNKGELPGDFSHNRRDRAGHGRIFAVGVLCIASVTGLLIYKATEGSTSPGYGPTGCVGHGERFIDVPGNAIEPGGNINVFQLANDVTNNIPGAINCSIGALPVDIRIDNHRAVETDGNISLNDLPMPDGIRVVSIPENITAKR